MTNLPKYINPYTDFGFKKLFGEEANKDLLIDFLNQLLPPKHTIETLSFKNPDKMGDEEKDRRAFFDLYCESITGEQFIVEMQKAKVKYFKDRALFYTAFPIKEQGKRGEWNFKLSPIYFIAILDFKYDEEEEKAKFRRDVLLKDQDCEVFYDKLKFVFLQMPFFNKTVEELKTKFDKWCYFLKHLESFDEIPAILKEPVFEKAFNIAEVARMKKEDREQYEKSRLVYLEVKAVSDTSYEEGKEIGREEGIETGKEIGREEEKIELIKSLIQSFPDLSNAKIAALTKVSEELVAKIRNELNV